MLDEAKFLWPPHALCHMVFMLSSSLSAFYSTAHVALLKHWFSELLSRLVAPQGSRAWDLRPRGVGLWGALAKTSKLSALGA